MNTKQIDIFFKIPNSRQCWFTHLVRFVAVKLFLFWIKYWVRHQFSALVLSRTILITFRAISGSQLLQSMWISKHIVVLLSKICRKYGSVSHSFSCKKKLSQIVACNKYHRPFSQIFRPKMLILNLTEDYVAQKKTLQIVAWNFYDQSFSIVFDSTMHTYLDWSKRIAHTS